MTHTLLNVQSCAILLPICMLPRVSSRGHNLYHAQTNGRSRTLYQQQGSNDVYFKNTCQPESNVNLVQHVREEAGSLSHAMLQVIYLG